MNPTSFSYSLPTSPSNSRHRRESSSTYFSDVSDSTAFSETSLSDEPIVHKSHPTTCQVSRVKKLPPEIWADVFELLEAEDVPRVSLSCRFFYDVARDQDVLNRIGLRKLHIPSFLPFNSYRRFHRYYRNVVWMSNGVWWGDRGVFGSFLRTYYDVSGGGFGMQFVVVTEADGGHAGVGGVRRGGGGVSADTGPSGDVVGGVGAGGRGGHGGEGRGGEGREGREGRSGLSPPTLLPFTPTLQLAPVSIFCTPDLYYDQLGELHPAAVAEQISYAVQRCENTGLSRDGSYGSRDSLWPPLGHSIERTSVSSSGSLCLADASQNLFRLRKRLCPFRTPSNEAGGLTETFGRLESWFGHLGGIFVAPGICDDGPVFLNLHQTKTQLTATHITGGLRIPRGEVAFVSDFTEVDHGLEELGFGGCKGYSGWAQVAQHNYVDPEYVPVVVVVVDENRLAVWWRSAGVVTWVRRVDVASVRGGVPSLASP